jgi:hypothetical protein
VVHTSPAPHAPALSQGVRQTYAPAPCAQACALEQDGTLLPHPALSTPMQAATTSDQNLLGAGPMTLQNFRHGSLAGGPMTLQTDSRAQFAGCGLGGTYCGQFTRLVSSTMSS